nr:FAD/NAD(P)-binding protein [Kibdelosporangium sp. MJ126-NF4]CEL18576.1 Nitrogen regulatory protein P-II [Kibdelosporangium sp. MJ126-NF4]CTQ98060.1 Nitrogen regulatory protein P-II [Kibdelosporangium sp. MJ126-NF4]
MGIEIAVVGAGPRGLSVLERLCANERIAPSHPAVTVHVVDPVDAGPGAVWRTDQSRHLLTNTVASQISVYTDDSVTMDGPVEQGPSLYEWASSLALLGPLGDIDDEILTEARALGPDDYPTRALYGRYLQHAFERVVANAPSHMTIHVHRSHAVAIADTHGVVGGPQGIRLRNGTRLNQLDAVVLAQGHVPAKLTPREARTASLARIYYLTYLTPANPADVDLGGIDPGETVLLRGLGLNFFDYLALLTVGRGGTFRREGERLRYEASGREPRLFACSRRGVPYHARGENQKGAFGRYVPRLLTPEMITRLRERAGRGDWVRLDKDLWPVIAKEIESLYYGTWLTAAGRDDERSSFVCQYLSAGPKQQARLLDTIGVPLSERWDWDRIARPYAGVRFTDRAHFHGWLLDYLANDVREAKAGNVSGPLKAALDALRDLRNEIRLVVDHGGLEGQSYRDHLQGWYTPLNAYLSIGPPVSRIEEMIALVDAGVLELTGPGTQVAIDMAEPAFVAASPLVPGPQVRAQVLIEARLPEPDLRRTEDPLLRHMLDTDQCRPFSIPTAGGGLYETGGLAVTARPNRVIDAQGNTHPRRFAYGVPTEAVHWVTAAGIRPGVDSMTVGDSDAIARAVLALDPVADVPATAVEENPTPSRVIV